MTSSAGGSGNEFSTVYTVETRVLGAQEGAAQLNAEAQAAASFTAQAKLASAADIEFGAATKLLVEAITQLNTTLSSNSAGIVQRRAHVTEATKADREMAVGLREGSAGLREMLVPMTMIGAQLGPITELLRGGAGALGSFGGAAISASSLGLDPLVIALGLGVAAIAGFAVATTSLGTQWEDTMTTIGIASQQTEEQVASIGETLKQVSVETGTSAVALGDGYASVIGRLQLYNQNAALTDEQNQALIKSAAMLSAVTGEDEKKSFDALATSVTALKLPLEQIPELADKLYNTSRVTGVSVDELADAIGRMSARAGPAGAAHDIDALLTTTIAASQAGLQGAQSFRLLNTVFDDMVSPTDKLTSQIQGLGINMEEFAGAGAQERLTMLGQHWLALGDPTRVAAEATELFGRNGGVAVTVMEGLATNADAANVILGDQGALVAANTQKQKDLTKEWEDWVQSVKNFSMGAGLEFVQDLKNIGAAYTTLMQQLKDNPLEVTLKIGNDDETKKALLLLGPIGGLQAAGFEAAGAAAGVLGGIGGALDTAGRQLPGAGGSQASNNSTADEYASSRRDSVEELAQAERDQAAAEAAVTQATIDGDEAARAAAETRQTEIAATIAGITVRHQEAEAAARFGESAKAAGQALEQIGEGIEPTNKQLETLWTEIDRLGTKNASALATSEQAKGLLTRIAGGDPAAYEQMIGLIKTLGDETEKAQKKAHVPPKTSEMGLEEGFAQGTPQARDLAGTAGGEAISALQKAAQDRADSIARTGEDSAAGPATAAASAALKAIDAARKAGVEGWEEYDAEVRPIMKKALEGDTDSMQEFIALMSELNQKTVDATAATKWATAWEEAMRHVDAQARTFADQREKIDRDIGEKLEDENQKHSDAILAEKSRTAVREVEISTKLLQEEVAETTKAADQKSDADKEYYRKKDDLASKFKEENDKLIIEEAAKTAEMMATNGDKEADLATKNKRTHEDLATDTKRKEEDLAADKTLTPAERAKKEAEIQLEVSRKKEDMVTNERRAQEDAETAFSKAKRDEATKETVAANERKVTQDAESKAAETAHTRKLSDLDTEESRRITAIQKAASNEAVLDLAKHNAQATYFQDEETKENHRHQLAMDHYAQEGRDKQSDVDTNSTRAGQNELDTERDKYMSIHGGSSEGFDEAQAASDIADHLAGDNSSGRTPPPLTSSASAGTGLPASYGSQTNPSPTSMALPPGSYGSLYSGLSAPYGGLTPSSTTNSAVGNINLSPGVNTTPKPPAGAKTDDCQCITDAIKDLANRPIQVYLDGKQLETSLTKRQYQSVETRTAVGGTF